MTVCVYGATGWTGRLVARLLYARGIPIVVAGRSSERCQEVARKLHPSPPCRVAALDDPGGLAQALAGASALVNCAGPFVETGPPLLEAALRAGVTYVDISGEGSQVADVYHRWHATAQRAGLAICPAIGGKGALGDWAAHLVAPRLGGLSPDLIAISYAHYPREFLTASIGSYLSAAGQRFVGERNMVPAEIERTVTFPSPFGTGRALKVPGAVETSVPRHLPVRSVQTYVSVDPGGPLNQLWAQALVSGYSWLPLLAKIMMSEWGRFHLRLYLPPPQLLHKRDTFGMLVEGWAGDRYAKIGMVAHDAYSITAEVVSLVLERILGGTTPPTGVVAPSQVINPQEAIVSLRDRGVLHIH